MKAFQIFTHPVALIVGLLLILISGQHFGGFYMIYLLQVLPHGGIHALLGFFGILLLVIATIKYCGDNKYKMEGILKLTGACFLPFSLLLFFYNDKQGYNSPSFEQTVPSITLGLFGLLFIVFTFYSIRRIFSGRPLNGGFSVS